MNLKSYSEILLLNVKCGQIVFGPHEVLDIVIYLHLRPKYITGKSWITPCFQGRVSIVYSLATERRGGQWGTTHPTSYHRVYTYVIPLSVSPFWIYRQGIPTPYSSVGLCVGAGIFLRQFSDQGHAQLRGSQCKVVFYLANAIHVPKIFCPPPSFPPSDPGDRVSILFSQSRGCLL